MVMKNVMVLGFLLFVGFSHLQGVNSEKVLARQILKDSSLCVVHTMAQKLIKTGFNAGSGYSQVWIRDFNTFVETALDVQNQKDIRTALLIFFAFQQPNGEMIDGYVLKKDFTWSDDHPYMSTTDTTHIAFKNTVETDQESSLIQCVGKYIIKTGDTSILSQKVDGKTVLERMEMMVHYLMKEKYCDKYGLIWGGTTADWGDVQACSDDLVDINSATTPAISIYDNAMFIIALDYLSKMTSNRVQGQKWKSLKNSIAQNVRKYLWDTKHKKFIPHIYIDKSPMCFPLGFDESKIYYHGGTAIAIEAGLLNKKEIDESNKHMLDDVQLSGAQSIGLTLYPPYPKNVFHGAMSNPYIYQNGGDWTWFGARMIQQLIVNGFIKEAYIEMQPMIKRVILNKGFYEWYDINGKPAGSGNFKGSAGTLDQAIEMLLKWADEHR
jgi:hypothetical protein